MSTGSSQRPDRRRSRPGGLFRPVPGLLLKFQAGQKIAHQVFFRGIGWPNRNIGVPAAQVNHLQRGLQVQFDTGVFVTEVSQMWPQQGQHEGIGSGNAKIPDQLEFATFHLALHIVNGFLYHLGGINHFFRFRMQQQAVFTAFKNPAIQRFFETMNSTQHGASVNAKLTSRRRD